ncbi:intraflagellar transport protein 80 [Scenedesmus sp. NREL 46B-D3]|nr:intraflagellar transport protein 80 [Scenedesmus sp. NREL 46B-D3]
MPAAAAAGTAVATAGEDGQVKVWSRAGMLRSTIAQADEPAYCVCWGGGSSSGQLLFCSGSNVTTAALQGTGGIGAGSRNSCGAHASWKAHDALVLTADWNVATNLIVTGAEDCKYKVWDAFGRLLYQSSVWEHSITSVAWSPDGALFAAGSYNCLALCDKQGWSYCQVRPSSCSLLGLCWSPDGTSLAACGGNGSLTVAALLDVRLEDGRVAAVLEGERLVSVVDCVSETQERLEFRDPVVKMSLGCGHLLVCSATQCHIYSTLNWNTPHIFDLKEPAQLVLQSGRGFALVDASGAAQVFTYEGRPVCGLKLQGQGTGAEALHRQLISLSNDTLAVASGSSVRCFETAQGRPAGQQVNHSLEIKAVCLSQFGNANDRLLAVLDANGDLYMLRPLAPSGSGTGSSTSAAASPTKAAAVGAANGQAQQQQQQSQLQQRMVKLASCVSGQPVWHDAAPMLAAVVDGQLVVWYHPAAAFVDRDLLEATKSTQNDGAIGAGASLDLFAGSSLMLRLRNGAHVCASIAPQPAMLHDLVRQGHWDKAVRLARFSHDPAVWACLAALAMASGELCTAEAAYAAIDAVDKLQFVLHLRGKAGAGAGGGAAGEVAVAAKLALYRRQPDDAEAMLLQAGLVYRAIKLHVRLHNWQRALDLARKHQQHQDTVLMHRRRHLAAVGQKEVLADFAALAQETDAGEALPFREA